VPYDAAARRQCSFSRLTGKLHAQPAGGNFSPLDAEASAAPPLDARGLGTLVHAVLAEIDFARPGDIARSVRRCAEQQLLESELGSPRAAEIAAAKEMYRELEFLLAWPPGGCETGGRKGDSPHLCEAPFGPFRQMGTVPFSPASDGRYLQGFIDCLYCDAAGGWRLVDYKTNRVTADTLAAVAAPYEMQMLVYALAVEQILQRKPEELVLCFLRPGLEYRFSWDAAARQRVVDLVSGALPH
jgi:ATP-dependent exoDNAse (exonuclease V) beta subunit